MSKNILVVDDEEDILSLVEYNLAKSGYDITCVTTGEDALKITRSATPDLIVLDLMLPGKDGLEVCGILKSGERTKTIPVIMLTAKGEESDVVKGLEIGADDYITKPFSPNILIARTKAVLRRASAGFPDEMSVVRIHDIEIHPGQHRTLIGGEFVDLTRTEFRILHYLARRPGWVFTRQQIIDAVHGDDYPVTDRSIDVQIVSLRKKLGHCSEYLETVRGIGYRFKD